MRKDPGEKGSEEMRGMSPEGSSGQEANAQPKEGAGLMREVRKKGSNGTDSDVSGMSATEETNASLQKKRYAGIKWEMRKEG